MTAINKTDNGEKLWKFDRSTEKENTCRRLTSSMSAAPVLAAEEASRDDIPMPLKIALQMPILLVLRVLNWRPFLGFFIYLYKMLLWGISQTCTQALGFEAYLEAYVIVTLEQCLAFESITNNSVSFVHPDSDRWSEVVVVC